MSIQSADSDREELSRPLFSGDKLSNAIAQMPPDQRLVGIMHFEQGLSLDAVARLLGRDNEQVRSLIAGARETLARFLDVEEKLHSATGSYTHKPAAGDTSAATSDTDNPSESRRRTVLIVDDEPIVALSERDTIERNGYQVVYVLNGEHAIELVARSPNIDVVLMDIDLGPDQIDGIETARRIFAVRSVPIVFLTGHAEPEYLDQADDLHACGYVLKSAPATTLLRAVRSAFALAGHTF